MANLLNTQFKAKNTPPHSTQIVNLKKGLMEFTKPNLSIKIHFGYFLNFYKKKNGEGEDWGGNNLESAKKKKKNLFCLFN